VVRIVPPSRAHADSNDSRVRVEGSKNRLDSTAPCNTSQVNSLRPRGRRPSANSNSARAVGRSNWLVESRSAWGPNGWPTEG